MSLVEVYEFETEEECTILFQFYCSKYLVPQRIKGKEINLENSETKVTLSNFTALPTQITDKSTKITTDIDISLIRYTEHMSESGAYIFAPGHLGTPLKLKALDIFSIDSEISQQAIVFFKTVYKPSCFAVATIWLDQEGDSIEAP